MVDKKEPVLFIRNAEFGDIDQIVNLAQRVYKEMPAYSDAQIRGHLNRFPEGQFVAVHHERIVGYCATIRVSEEMALKKHTWNMITGRGYASTHDPDGEYLYGMEVFVDPEARRLRIGQRLYRARKELCRYFRLKGIVFGGRLPLLQRKIKITGTAEEYIKQVLAKKIRDPVMSFQIRQGFKFLGLLPEYVPLDRESMGYASHMIWHNIEQIHLGNYESAYSARISRTVRIGTVQYKQRRIHSLDEFKQIVQYFIDVVANYRGDFVVFPELFTLQLLSIENEEIPGDRAIEKLTEYTEELRSFFSEQAVRFNINIIAGSHPTKYSDGSVRNVSIICLRDGSIHEQEKLHPTPSERYWWKMEGGNDLRIIQTDCGPIGVLICYDCEFPELARHLVDQGANIIFVPFCTDERQSYQRVRYCAQARAVENQVFVVMSGNVGNLPRVANMSLQYGQSCILTPCDISLARDGIAADTTPNVETVAFADLKMDDLFRVRNNGTVLNLRDRRHDLYGVVWHSKRKPKSD